MTKQVEIYSDYYETCCDLCGSEVGHVARCDVVGRRAILVCENCIEHSELIDERLQKKAAYFEEMAADCQRDAACARALIGKLKLPSLTDFRAAVEDFSAAEEAADVVNAAHADEAEQEGSPRMTDKTEGAPGELSQAEKLQTLLNDQRVARERNAATYHQFATDEADTPRGRFTAIEKPTVIGASPVEYPPQPENSPWASDPVPSEPLIDATDCGATFGTALGEPHELIASPLESPFSAQGNSPSPASEEVAPPDPLGVERRDAGLGPLPTPSEKSED